MNKTDILNYLKENKDARGIKHWENAGVKEMSSLGIGVTKLKTFAKQVGKNHNLALELWEEPIFESRVLSTLIDNPKLITRKQINQQVNDLNFWMLSHSYCNYLLPKFPGIKQLAEEWMVSTNNLKKRCSFQLVYQIAKNDKKLNNDYFIPIIEGIKIELQKQENFVKDAMNNALWGIGIRNIELNKLCIEAAKHIGMVKVDYGQNSCEAINVVAHLTSDRIQKKFF